MMNDILNYLFIPNTLHLDIKVSAYRSKYNTRENYIYAHKYLFDLDFIRIIC